MKFCGYWYFGVCSDLFFVQSFFVRKKINFYIFKESLVNQVKSWNEEDINRAISKISTGISIRAASRAHGMFEVRRRIIIQISGAIPERAMLTSEEESQLTRCIGSM